MRWDTGTFAGALYTWFYSSLQSRSKSLLPGRKVSHPLKNEGQNHVLVVCC